MNTPVSSPSTVALKETPPPNGFSQDSDGSIEPSPASPPYTLISATTAKISRATTWVPIRIRVAHLPSSRPITQMVVTITIRTAERMVVGIRSLTGSLASPAGSSESNPRMSRM